ncbi:MAG: hypothetical protein V3W32_05845 [Gemmatimonadota bacterium]
MSERVEHVDAHLGVPDELLGGPQRYYIDKERGSHGLVYYFPDGPQPEGPISQVYAGPGPQMRRADSIAAEDGWTFVAPGSSNTVRHDSSPWGYAVETRNLALGHSGAAGCFNLGPKSVPLWDPASQFSKHSWALFMIVKHRDELGSYQEFFLTHLYELAAEESLEIGLHPGTKNFVMNHGNPSTSQSQWVYDLSSWWPDDGWLRLAVNMKRRSGALSNLDLWLNGIKVRDGSSPITASGADMTRCVGVRIGANYERKDGLSWDGYIAQIACIAGGTDPLPDHAIRRWFDDPWYFLKAERFTRDYHGCPEGSPSIAVAAEGVPEISAATVGTPAVELAAEGAPAIDVAAEGTPGIGPACEGVPGICPKGAS